MIDGLRERLGRPRKGDRVRLSLNPNVVTATGILLALGAAVLIGARELWYAIPVLTAAGLTDLLDGVVARRSGRQSRRGAFLDSVADRLIDTILCSGVIYYLASVRSAPYVLLGVAALGSGYLISYERAKAEAMGYQAKGGLMERAERLILLGISLGFSGAIMVPTLAVLTGLSLATAAGRFMRVYAQAARDDGLELSIASRTGKESFTALVERWRSQDGQRRTGKRTRLYGRDLEERLRLWLEEWRKRHAQEGPVSRRGQRQRRNLFSRSARNP